MINPHDSGAGLMPIISDKEFLQLGKTLHKNSPGCTCDWDVLHDSLQTKWVGFARFAYGTIITILEAPLDERTL